MLPDKVYGQALAETADCAAGVALRNSVQRYSPFMGLSGPAFRASE